MIITKDMLETKGFSPGTIDQFEQEFPNGFDFLDPYLPQPSFILIEDLAGLFHFSGLYTCDDNFNVLQCNFVNGIPENLSNRNPAYVIFDKQRNIIIAVRFYTNGRLNNPGKLKPAVVTYHDNQSLYMREFFCNGKRNNPCEGIAAQAVYDDRGNLMSETHYNMDNPI